jgi:hypothetical protein
LEAELREEVIKLKAERLSKESFISRLELAASENIDRLTELQNKFKQVSEFFSIISRFDIFSMQNCWHFIDYSHVCRRYTLSIHIQNVFAVVSFDNC